MAKSVHAMVAPAPTKRLKLLPNREAIKRVVMLGMPAPFRTKISADAEAMGYAVEDDVNVEDAGVTPALCGPAIVLVNLDMESGLEAVASCKARTHASSHVVAITDVACLLRAGNAVRHGASVVLARPTTLPQIVSALEGHGQGEPAPMSLDRAIWEFINQTVIEAGSIAAAARRLRLDRTSLKRMLRKSPPAR